MSDLDPNLTPDGQPKSEDAAPAYTPASPAKRALAWMGIVYMVIIIALTTYGLATGSILHGIAGIMVAPACFTLAVLQVMKFRPLRQAGQSAWGALTVGALGAAAGLYSLADGLCSLLAQF